MLGHFSLPGRIPTLSCLALGRRRRLVRYGSPRFWGLLCIKILHQKSSLPDHPLPLPSPIRYDPFKEGFALSWVNDLSSVLGIPTGAATLAVAIYGGCAAAESAASPEVLGDISRALSDRSWSESAQAPALIGQLFAATFGERHFSFRCALASAIATFYILIALLWLVNRITGNLFSGYGMLAIFSEPIDAIQAWVGVFIAAFIPDYIALAKTRLLTRIMGHIDTIFSGLLLVGFDIVLSAIISFGGAIFLLDLVFHTFFRFSSFISLAIIGTILSPNEYINNSIALEIGQGAEAHLTIVNLALANLLAPFVVSNGILPMFSITCWSTVFTSVWTLLILLSAVAIQIITPIQRFTIYFFDVTHHPLRAIGVVSGTLVMIGSLVWTVLRVVF